MKTLNHILPKTQLTGNPSEWKGHHRNRYFREALLHESYSRYRFRMLFVCQLLFSIRSDSGLPKWIIRLRMAQPRRLSTC